MAKHFIEKGFNRLAIGGKMVMVTKRRDWYRGQAKPEKDGYGGLSAHKSAILQKRHPMRGHILLSEHQLVATKGCKNATGGFAPQTPRKLADFLFMKIGGYGIS